MIESIEDLNFCSRQCTCTTIQTVQARLS